MSYTPLITLKVEVLSLDLVLDFELSLMIKKITMVNGMKDNSEYCHSLIIFLHWILAFILTDFFTLLIQKEAVKTIEQ
ncbi:Uncharacterised protein [Escherichia coli]|nr:Uncharacterised protein [Escherichia coli]